MKKYFENTIEIEKMKNLCAPSKADSEKVISLVKDDVELTLYFYDKLNPSWLELLERAKEFEGLDVKEAGLIERYKAAYLAECAKANSDAVLRVIQGAGAKDKWVQGKLADAIEKMPEQIAVKGVPIVLDYVGARERMIWHFAGEKAAKLMVKLLADYPEEAFKIAKTLLDVWRPTKEEAGVFERIRYKFATHEYKDLIFKYYSKVWEKRPFDATRLLVEIYDEYLEVLNKEKEGDVSEYLGISLRDLEDDYHLDRDVEAIIVKATCEAGKVVVEKEPKKISELMENFEKRNKGVFHRVEMYLLRFVPPGTEKERIDKLVGNHKFVESPLYKYEHRKLLNDKFDDVSDEIIKAFLEGIDKNKYYDEEHRKDITEWCKKNNKPLQDFEKLENYQKAKELYLVRERFKDEYERYKKAAEVKNDSELAPRETVGETRDVSPEEGSPYSSEKMGKDSVEIVINRLLETKIYEEKENIRGWGTTKDAQAESFGFDVKKRPEEYLKSDLGKLEKLDPAFLQRFFHAVSETVRAGSFKKEGWERLIDLASRIVEANKGKKEWRECFLAILWVLNDGFGEEDNRIKFNETIIEKHWFILKELVGYNFDEKSDSEEDPIQRQLRSVQGGAFNQIVSLEIECKNKFAMVFDSFLKKEITPIYEFVVKEVKRSEVNCTLGHRFANIYWLDKEWVESNIEQIFDKNIWNAVWGSYVSWGRTSPPCFRFLVEKGKYGEAIKRIGDDYKYKFGKEPDMGLVEHLMIGYFNGWINYDSNELQQFFKKASAELRGKAVGFLTTGFKSTKEGDDEKYRKDVEERMRIYWKGRLAAIKDKPKENEKEAIAFTGWVENSILPAKETLELLEQTLESSSGQIGELRDANSFVKGIRESGKGNELLALRCLKRAAEDKNMHYPWAQIEDSIVQFLDGLPENVRSEGREVADLYGRYNPDKFRGVWEKLKK